MVNEPEVSAACLVVSVDFFTVSAVCAKASPAVPEIRIASNIFFMCIDNFNARSGLFFCLFSFFSFYSTKVYVGYMCVIFVIF